MIVSSMLSSHPSRNLTYCHVCTCGHQQLTITKTWDPYHQIVLFCKHKDTRPNPCNLARAALLSARCVALPSSPKMLTCSWLMICLASICSSAGIPSLAHAFLKMRRKPTSTSCRKHPSHVKIPNSSQRQEQVHFKKAYSASCKAAKKRDN